MRLHQVCLNLTKCAFGIQSSQFLGYIVNQRVIEVKLEKLKVIEGMCSPTYD